MGGDCEGIKGNVCEGSSAVWEVIVKAEGGICVRAVGQ